MYTFALLAFVVGLVPGPGVLNTVGVAVSITPQKTLNLALSAAAGHVMAAVLVIVVTMALGRDTLVVLVLERLSSTYLIVSGLFVIWLRLRLGHTERSTELPGKFPFIMSLTNPKSLAFLAATVPEAVGGVGLAGRAAVPIIYGTALGLITAGYSFAAAFFAARSSRLAEHALYGCGAAMIAVGVMTWAA